MLPAAPRASMKAISSFAPIVFLVVVAHATPASAGFKTGNALFQDCEAQSNEVALGLCLGYISGVTDALTESAHDNKNFRVCMRNGVTAKQVRDIVVKYLTDTPAIRDMPADVLIGAAISQAFPC